MNENLKSFCCDRIENDLHELKMIVRSLISKILTTYSTPIGFRDDLRASKLARRISRKAKHKATVHLRKIKPTLRSIAREFSLSLYKTSSSSKHQNLPKFYN